MESRRAEQAAERLGAANGRNGGNATGGGRFYGGYGFPLPSRELRFVAGAIRGQRQDMPGIGPAFDACLNHRPVQPHDC